MTAILSLLLETKDPIALHCGSCKPNSTYTKHLSFRAEFRQVCKFISRKIYSLQRKSNKDHIWGCLDIAYPPSDPPSTARNHRLSICVDMPWNAKLALLNVLGLAPCLLARAWQVASSIHVKFNQESSNPGLYQYNFCTSPAQDAEQHCSSANESTQIQSHCSTIMICFVVDWMCLPWWWCKVHGWFLECIPELWAGCWSAHPAY